MKRFKFISAFFAILTAISFASCEVEALDSDLLNNINEEEPAGPALFKVDFGNQTFVATSTQAVIADGMIAITGTRGTDGETVGIGIPATTTGTFSGDEVFMSYDPSTNSEYTYNNLDPSGQDNGTVTITSIDTQNQTISGTFSFTGYWGDESANLPAVPFTNGVFTNIPYTGTIPGPGPGEEEEYFKATINGTAKDYGNIVTASVGTSTSIGGTIVSPMSNVQVVIPQANMTAGTYALGNNPFSGPMGIVSDGPSNSFTSISGSLTIISVGNGRIKGTFNFIAANPTDPTQTIQVTQGSFDTELP